MKFNNLDFKRKSLPKDKELNEDRPYIEFIVDGIPLSKILGLKELDITPFGWGNNTEFELKNARRLISFKKSEFPNGLQSAYVCANCGDEGCGAIMFNINNHGSYVEWNNFVESDGYPTKNEPDKIIFTKSLYFEISKYQESVGKLLKLIKE